MKFLGEVVSAKGQTISLENISKVQNWPTPTSTRVFEIFLGILNYHRDHLKSYAELASPLYQLTGSKGRRIPFVWTKEHHTAFSKLKTAMTSTPGLGFPMSEAPFILDTDASDVAVGAELSQVQKSAEANCYWKLCADTGTTPILHHPQRITGTSQVYETIPSLSVG